MSNIAWVDAETDGLDAHENHLLEIACLVTDENLNILDPEGFHAIVHYSWEEVERMRDAAFPVVQEMHDKTGLWGKLYLPEGRAVDQCIIDATLVGYLKQFGEPGTMPVGGNSVRLDMNFMDRHLPATSEFLDYHMRDVSTIAGLASDWYDLPYFEKHSDHTAMVDIKESIRELKHYRETIFKTSFAKMPQWERDEVTADVMSYLLSVGYTITAPGGGAVSATKASLAKVIREFWDEEIIEVKPASERDEMELAGRILRARQGAVSGTEYEYAWMADEEKRQKQVPKGPRLMFDKSMFYTPEKISSFPKGKRVRRRPAGPWEEVPE